MNCSTTEEDLLVDPVESPEILDDLELPKDEAVDIKDMEVNKLKLNRRIHHFKVLLLSPHFHFVFFFVSFVTNNTYLQIELQNSCRQGKKLLVLDIDYTLFDHRSTAENPLQLMRPCNFISPLPSLLAFPFKNAIFNH